MSKTTDPPGTYFAGLTASPTLDRFALAVLRQSTDSRNYFVRGLRRWSRVSLTQVVQDVAAMVRPAPLTHCTLVVDRSFLGNPPVALLRDAAPVAAVRPVTVTTGTEPASEGGDVRIPLADLSATLRLVLESGRLEIPGDAQEPETLQQEIAALCSPLAEVAQVAGAAGLALSLALYLPEQQSFDGEIPLDPMCLEPRTPNEFVMEQSRRQGLLGLK